MLDEPRYEPGQELVAVAHFGWRLTEGKTYRVVEYIDAVMTPTFRFPPYVSVIDDLGEKSSYHTHRFRPAGTQEPNGR